MRAMLMVLAMLTGSASAAAETGCNEAAFRQFDFWVGEWEVTDARGQRAGHNSIRLEQQSCAVIERWESARGGTGMSMNHFDPRSGKWHQHWIGLGLMLEMTGELRGNEMVLEGPLHYVNEQRTTILKGTWTPLADGRVRQHFVESADGGKTWTEWFDGYYRRDAASERRQAAVRSNKSMSEDRTTPVCPQRSYYL